MVGLRCADRPGNACFKAKPRKIALQASGLMQWRQQDEQIEGQDRKGGAEISRDVAHAKGHDVSRNA